MKFGRFMDEVNGFSNFLTEKELAESTVKQYLRDVKAFLNESRDKAACKETVIAYKNALALRYEAASVNVKLAALNGFFHYINRPDLKVSRLKIQRSMYLSEERELTKKDYFSLIEAARSGGGEMAGLIIMTICSTGIRVSELKYITAEAIAKKKAVIRLKGKTRVVFIPDKLAVKLKGWAKKKNIKTGALFLNRNGKCVDRIFVWRSMKKLAARAGVDPARVFPHNLRHLFARCFYDENRDIAKLSDVLGHSSIDTTRIYIMSSGQKHREQIERLELVC